MADGAEHADKAKAPQLKEEASGRSLFTGPIRADPCRTCTIQLKMIPMNCRCSRHVYTPYGIIRYLSL